MGDNFSKETEAELATGQQGAPPRDAKDHKKKIVGGPKAGTSTTVKEAIKSVDAILHALG